MRKHFAFSLAAALAVAVIVIAGAPPAAIALPPDKVDCSMFTDAFERVKCRHDAVADQMAHTADMVFAPGTVLHGRAGPGRVKHIGNARVRGQRAKGQLTMGALKKLAKAEVRGNRKAGHLVPFDEFADDTNGDGICDFEQGDDMAQCAAVELDAMGDLQACNPGKKNKGKGKPGPGKFAGGLECDLSFDPENADNPEEAFDMDQAAQGMEETFSAVEDDFIEMNGLLEDINMDGSASLRAAATDECNIPVFSNAAKIAALAGRLVAAIAQGAASVQDSVFSQTVVVFGAGGNLRSSASVMDYAAAVLKVAYIIADEIVIDQKSQVQTATNACIASTVEQVGDLATQVGNLATQVGELRAQMLTQHGMTRTNDNTNTEALRVRLGEVEDELSRLLNTPHGQRNGFPSQ